MGGPIPESYYLSGKTSIDIANKKSLTVSSGTKQQLEYDVQAGNALRLVCNCDASRLIPF